MVSLIIPIYNEEQGLPRLLKSLISLQDAAEILFVDGGSKDESVKRIQRFIQRHNKIISSTYNNHGLVKKGNQRWKQYPRHNIQLLISPQKGRANQMNYGAKHSQGDILFFVHGDSQLPHNAIEKVEYACQTHQAGCFSIAFDSPSLLMKCCGYLSGVRVNNRKIMFGDQGIFIHKTLFFGIGGYRPIPLMEDYQLSMDLKEKKTPIIKLPEKIITSARRFEQQGKLKTMAKMQIIQHQYRKGVSPVLLAQRYRKS